MQVTRWLVCAGLMLTGCKKDQPARHATPPAAEAGALSSIKLVSELPNGEWTLPAGDYANTRYSPLAQITRENVKDLKVLSSISTGVPHGHEGQPLVVGDTLYVVTPYPNFLFAVDLSKKGTPLKWTYAPNPDPRSVGIACCDVVNRGASYANGKIIYALLDGHVVAVDAETGKEVWRTKTANIDVGETITMAPLVVKNLVIVGDSGGELGVRGKLTALDVETGQEVWHAYNNGPDADVLIGDDFKPFYEKDRGKDLGVTSWPPDQWKLGGATVWGWISYDPGLNTIYYGTSNPGAWNPDVRLGTNHWACSIIARDADTGRAKWAYQIVPHDSWDYDEIMENVLVDMEWGGRMRKLLLHPGRTGFMFVLDRETGELLSAQPFQPVNWASGYDLKTGLPQKNPEKETHQGVNTKGICPSSTGAKDFIPSAFSPRTGYLYIPAHNTCMNYEGVSANYIAGTPYLGASVQMYPGPGDYQGELVAWDVAAQKPAWGVKEKELPVYSGVLATGGDLVFYGTMDGWFRALDAKSGQTLWEYKTPSGIVGDPITFNGPDGKQYVAVYSGVGGWMGAVAFPSVSADDQNTALGVVGAMKQIKHLSGAGDALFIFAL